ncbi:hypothetical protein SPRG_04223 [Saprolegnia parasitica CBS 223.65]|uniref:Uncharacterized protein n=1 Tax=Saprolegnia parasitica (strain CBS 223.65) TaxID=695850 RepID=A0A067CWW1_SAPPC|nr:hypothetical protein SPRG_04223 [Saprolegnia parasitica CBS 223.65]KDO31036.1 hypothetical protein SPRG_04223 [Saprolegnia parasitica CBS 223.65]|eukprot:XP_012198213.1 hypothetical protein SPRG_04223 [Saprolegnia parasitica CBS 223.65]
MAAGRGLLDRVVGRLRGALPSRDAKAALLQAKAKDMAEAATSATTSRLTQLQAQSSAQLQETRARVLSSAQALAMSSKARLQDMGASAVDASKHKLQAVGASTANAAKHKFQAVRSSATHVAKETLQRAGGSLTDASKSVATKAQQQVTKVSQNALGGAVKAHASTLQRHLVESMDPREKARKLRNQVLWFVFSAIFVYGFASAIPPAISKYLVEKERLAAAQPSRDEA